MPNIRLARALQALMIADPDDQSGIAQDQFVATLISEGVIEPHEDALVRYAYLDYDDGMLLLSMPHRQVVIRGDGSLGATH